MSVLCSVAFPHRPIERCPRCRDGRIDSRLNSPLGARRWLLRVHQAMQYISQMPNGLMTVQRLICPAASPENGGLAAEGGVLAVDWMMIEQANGQSPHKQ